jgi:hypothetical protein
MRGTSSRPAAVSIRTDDRKILTACRYIFWRKACSSGIGDPVTTNAWAIIPAACHVFSGRCTAITVSAASTVKTTAGLFSGFTQPIPAGRGKRRDGLADALCCRIFSTILPGFHVGIDGAKHIGAHEDKTDDNQDDEGAIFDDGLGFLGETHANLLLR